MITALNQIILSLLFLSACIIVNQLALAAKYSSEYRLLLKS